MTSTKTIAIDGTGFALDGRPFLFQGLSFFNAVFSPSFNRSDGTRTQWLSKFKDNGVTVLRLFGQWDCGRGWVDAFPDSTLYEPNGWLREAPVRTLKAILEALERQDMVAELAAFVSQSEVRLSAGAQKTALEELTAEMKPHRNLILQIWNEDSENVLGHLEAIKALDSDRLVTNSPGWANDLGDEAQNTALDLLTPHTVRDGKFWEEAPKQIRMLIEQYGKPVVDDEPARPGVDQYSGREEKSGTAPGQHVAHIVGTQEAGGHSTYHHNMFQYGYGHPETPPDGIPDPDLSPFHRQVIDHFKRTYSAWARENEKTGV